MKRGGRLTGGGSGAPVVLAERRGRAARRAPQPALDADGLLADRALPLKEFRERAQRYGPAALDCLAAHMAGTDKRTAVEAAKAVIAHAYGQPQTSLTVDGGMPVVAIILPGGVALDPSGGPAPLPPPIPAEADILPEGASADDQPPA